MASTSKGIQGKAFSNDLRRIREKMGYDLSELHEATKIPIQLLKEFEATGLFEHPGFNSVYLRSLVRTYAVEIGVPEGLALESLQEALEGRYRGRLAEEVLGEKRPAEEEDVASIAQPDDEVPAERQKGVEKAAVSIEEPGLKEDIRALGPRRPSRVPTAGKPARESTPPLLKGDPSRVPPRPSGRARHMPKDVERQRSAVQWSLMVGVMVVLIAGISWGLYAVFIAQTPTEPVAPLTEDIPVVDRDTTQTEPETVPSRPRPALGDTMHFVVIAARGVVDPIRVTRDSDLRRPYWLEQGDSRPFPVLSQLIVEGAADKIRNMRLLLEGYEYPLGGRDSLGRLVITRRMAEAFLDTVSVPPADLEGQ